MAKHSMICHPDSSVKAVEAFEVDVERRDDGKMWIRYHVECPVDDLELGTPKRAERADELWRTTCFEAFLRTPGKAEYAEFNFAPSGEWAAYAFDSYRARMREISTSTEPQTGNDASEMHFALEAIFEPPEAMRDTDLLVAVTAVIEEKDGTKSYWSLVHPDGAPDFHHARCFALHLPAPARP